MTLARETSRVTTHRQRMPLWAKSADVAALALFAVAAYIVVNGAFVVRVPGLRISFRSEWRTLFWAVALLVTRHVILRRPALPEWIVGSVRDMARAAGPLPDDLELLAPDRVPSRARGRHPVLTVIAVTLLFGALTAIMTYPQVLYLDTG